MQLSRVRKLNNQEIGEGPIVYWMDRDIRTKDNWALLYAQELALKNKQPLIVVYNLVIDFLGGTRRQLDFKLKGLEVVAQNCEDKQIPFVVLVDETGKESVSLITTFCHEHAVGTLVTDFSPLKIQRAWKEKIATKVSCAFFEVDAHNVVPAWIASPRQEYAAYTIRPKLYKLFPEYLEEFPSLKKHPYVYTKKIPHIKWDELHKIKSAREDVLPVDWITAGEDAGLKSLHEFVKKGLPHYALARNDANEKGQSNLSPYLHYGMISAQRIALLVLDSVGLSIDAVISRQSNKAKVDQQAPLSLTDHAGAFLEELLIRRELSDNFCLYNPDYDSFNGFPKWAQKSLNKHRTVKREYTYTQKQFEHAQTHDELWNAAQREMVQTGKMHGYMRMYWAKKILEWTASPEKAMEIAIYLNDTYELDGRDPNGYAGIAWSIGGVHDRAWFERPIFGLVRYMARSGCEKQFDVKRYIQKYKLQSLF